MLKFIITLIIIWILDFLSLKTIFWKQKKYKTALCYKREPPIGTDIEKNNFLLLEKCTNNNAAYIDESKSKGKEVYIVFVTLFQDIFRRTALLKKASIHTIIKTIMKEICINDNKHTLL